jgi:hypothetical protein
VDQKIETWEGYWNLFDELCHSLTAHDQTEVVVDLREAQRYVNGLTDGWHEFLNYFQQAMKHKKKAFDKTERDLADYLVQTLKQSLSRR